MFFIPDVFLLWFQNGEIRGPRVSVGGAPVLGTDGTPVMRDALKLADEATITARMNAIPHSNYRAVVFTKEQYARTPLRDDTVDEHAQDMLYDFVAAGRVASAMDSDSHRKEAARRRVLSEYSDSVHHTDRTLLAHYRASLKSAIQRKANITQAISRYEKLLNRTQKAATDIKRLRPLVEDAINKGILDVDPDLVNHANEFLVIGDRSWRVGQYYDCAGDIVRIKSLDFDSQRADVEIIFTFKGTKSGNWDVKTLDKQVDVTPDEDAVMQKISGGVSIAGINDIISCDDFYRFQQRGMIKITDSYGVQTTESGYSIDFVGTYTDPLKHAVYPDRRDGALKSSIAKWVLGMMSEGNNRQVRLAEVFLTELFGSNYGDVIASYGDTLSPEAIQEKIADAIARTESGGGGVCSGDSL